MDLYEVPENEISVSPFVNFILGNILLDFIFFDNFK